MCVSSEESEVEEVEEVRRSGDDSPGDDGVDGRSDPRALVRRLRPLRECRGDDVPAAMGVGVVVPAWSGVRLKISMTTAQPHPLLEQQEAKGKLVPIQSITCFKTFT